MATGKKHLVLVTGGAGYVGSTLTRDLLASGYRVRCLDLLLYGGKSIAGFINHPNAIRIKQTIPIMMANFLIDDLVVWLIMAYSIIPQ